MPSRSGVADVNLLHVFDVGLKTWGDLSSPLSGFPPVGRHEFGFTSLAGCLFVFGGYGHPYGSVKPVSYVLT